MAAFDRNTLKYLKIFNMRNAAIKMSKLLQHLMPAMIV